MQVIADLKELLLHMQPELHPGRYAFVTLPAGFPLDPAHVVASIREPEGLSVVIAEQVALELGLPVAFTAAWIALTVHADLSAVGLTAAFSQALAKAGISCNVVAGVCHDHLFVPVGRTQAAMVVLRTTQTAFHGILLPPLLCTSNTAAAGMEAKPPRTARGSLPSTRAANPAAIVLQSDLS